MEESKTINQGTATLAEIAEHLEKKLNEELVFEHPSNRQLYIKGHGAINQANRIFGYFGWECQTIEQIMTAFGVRTKVKVRVKNPETGEFISREGTGYNEFAGGKQNARTEDTAIKGSETDALKRALRTFGNQFGNSLYDGEGGDLELNEPEPPPKAKKKTATTPLGDTPLKSGPGAGKKLSELTQEELLWYKTKTQEAINSEKMVERNKVLLEEINSYISEENSS